MTNQVDSSNIDHVTIHKGAYPRDAFNDLWAGNLSTAHQILLQKQQEHAALQALRESSAILLQRVEQLAEMSNIMADGGEGMSLLFISRGRL
jgi:hypothetical protein